MTVKEHWGLSTPRQGKVPATLAVPDTVKIDSKENIGIEVEVENTIISGTIQPFWQSKQDNSLRNNGVEFVSLPIPACDAPAALKSLLEETLSSESCFSPRTSVHVHLNFLNDSTSVPTDVILLYTVFERLFFRFVGKARIRSIYCVPLTETDLLSQLGRKGLRVDYWQKYAGLNAKPLGSFGTLEFRHMHGTFDIQKLAIWIDLITKLKTYCVTVGTKQVRSTIASMEDAFDFNSLIKDVFGSTGEYLKYKSVEDVHYCYLMAKLGLSSQEATANLARALAPSSPFLSLGELSSVA